MTHSVETNATPNFAWNFWTNVANWNDPPAQFELYGPFATGTRGITRLPGQEPLHWSVKEVTPLKSAIIEMRLDGASLFFEWRLEDLADGRTRLTQRVLLTGEKAALHVSQVKAVFTASLPEGMNKLAAAMANADPNRKSA
jgi:Polyketide cyclase / dehydrase and lipid transport